jgi:hypothetical protein
VRDEPRRTATSRHERSLTMTDVDSPGGPSAGATSGPARMFRVVERGDPRLEAIARRVARTVGLAAEKAAARAAAATWARWAAWAAVAALSLGLSLLALGAYHRQYSTLGLFGGEAERQLARDSLARLGLTPEAFAWYALGCQGLRVLGSFAVAGLIVRARPGGVALFVSAFLMTAAAGRTLHVTPATAAWGWPAALVTAAAHAGLVLFFALFPDGRFAPRWARWPALAWCAVLVPPCLFPGAPFGLRAWPAALYPLVLAAVFATGVAAQLYRYARAAGPVGRRQIKWVLYGGAVLALLALAFAARDLGDPARGGGTLLPPRLTLADVAGIAATNLALLGVPLAIGAALLRHHLWDVDLVLSRTLVYVPLTAAVAGLYVAAVTLLQRLAVALTGQQSDAAVVATTLLVVAALNPAQYGLQKLVDRRFKEAPGSLARLVAWGDELAGAVYEVDGRRALRRLLDEAAAALGAPGGAAYLAEGGRLRLVHRRGPLDGGLARAGVSIPLEDEGGARLGLLRLGARPDGAPYWPHELAALERTARNVARALGRRGP